MSTAAVEDVAPRRVSRLTQATASSSAHTTQKIPTITNNGQDRRAEKTKSEPILLKKPLIPQNGSRPTAVSNAAKARTTLTSSSPAAPSTVVNNSATPSSGLSAASSSLPPCVPTASDSASRLVSSGSTSGRRFTAAKFDTHKSASILDANNNKFKTSFSKSYHDGSIPALIDHGSIKMRIKWTKDPERLAYNPLLVYCAEGLCETDHPYVFVSRICFKELLAAEGAYEKTLPLLSRIIPAIRQAMKSTRSDTVLAAIDALGQLSVVVKEALNPALSNYLSLLSSKQNDKTFREKIAATLDILVENGGEEAFRLVKLKIPTYST